MPKVNRYIFVLWGHHFDEAAAALFVTELRRTGLLVKVVGLNWQRVSGAHGLSLLPDWTLSEALPYAAQASGVIVPYSVSPFTTQFGSDPRLHEFFERAKASQACFIIKPGADPTWTAGGLFPLNRVRLYPAGEGLLNFVQELGERW